jgi:flagellar protein FlaG
MITPPISAIGSSTSVRKGPKDSSPTTTKETSSKTAPVVKAESSIPTPPPSEDTVQVSPNATTLAPPAEEVPQEEKAKTTPQDEATKQIQDIVGEAQGRVTSVQFQIDSEGGDTFVKVVDKESGETIKEIPTEEMRDLIERLRNSTKGVLIQDVS